MKELNLGQVIIENRRKRGITQEELAEHMGVSKTAVSKWETGSTYPDIILLPRLAAFFAISVDQLLDYRPQMEREEIRKLCQTLRRDFAAGPFQEVMDRCRELAKKYFACPELLFQLACLYMNHCALAGEQVSAVLEEALALVVRAKEESTDNFLITQAVNLEGFCLLRLGRPQEARRLLRSAVPLRMAPECLLAEACEMTGDSTEGKRVLQAGLYQTVLETINLLLAYLPLCREEDFAFSETARRILSLAENFRLESLHPAFMLSVFLLLAQEHLARGEEEESLDMLERYCRTATGKIYPLHLQGDSYFTLLDSWIEENLPLGGDLPRDETAVRKDTMQVLTTPVFARLEGNPRFREILRRMENDGRRY